MICNVCKDGIEGIWDPSRSKRLALLTDFLDEGEESVFEPSQYEHFRRRCSVKGFMVTKYSND